MSDFLNIFRRQRSIKQSIDEKSDEDNSHHNSDNSFVSGQPNSRKPSTSTEYDYSHKDGKQTEKEVFKEPKGWRKSLRKLKIKRQTPALSVSYDNIAKIPTNTDVDNKKTVKEVKSKSSFGKRWSYSPDICEENVPGARELRGTLKRNLSIKHEVDENSSALKYRESTSNKPLHLNEYDSSDRSRVVYDSGYASATKAPFSSPQLHQHELSSHNKSPYSSCQYQDHTTANFTKHNNTSISSTVIESPLAMPELYYPKRHESSVVHETADSTSLSYHSASSTQTSMLAGSDREALNEGYVRNIEKFEQFPSHLTPIHALHDQQVLRNYDDFNEDGSTIRTLTSSLLRGRAMTKFERDAEFALENAHSMSKSHDGPQYYLNESKNGSERHYEEFSDDDISWDSHEFDSFDESEDVMSNKEGTKEAKQKKVKDIPKKRFWDRTSLKKKISTSKPPDQSVETSSLDVIPPEEVLIPQLPVASPANLTDGQLKRRRIVATILSSEQSYVESLQRLVTDYKNALTEMRPSMIGADTIEKIFYKIPDILQEHRLFQIGLSSAVKHWDEEESIGATFVASFSKRMVRDCYGDFINNLTIAMDTVKKTCLRKPMFVSFLQDRQAESKDRLNLYGLMLKPVQRFPQFILLVQDLLKHTPKDHSDRLQLQLALTELEGLTDRLNRRKALDEDASELRSLMETSNLKLSNLTKDGRTRRLIKQGDVRERELNDDGLLEKIKDCLLVLTNDFLLCCAINNSFSHMNGMERRLSLNHMSASIYDALQNTVRQISSSIRSMHGRVSVSCCLEHGQAVNLFDLIILIMFHWKPHQRSATSTIRDMYKLKWRANLSELEVSDGSIRRSDYNEREVLHYDFITLKHINQLVGSLKLNHEGISTEILDHSIRNLEVKIRQAEQLATQPEGASFSVKFQGKSDTVSRTLVLPYNSQKEEWLVAISKAKLSISPGNLNCWFTPDHNEDGILWESPLFLRSFSAHLSYDTLQVQCAYSFMADNHVTMLWLSCAASTTVALVSVYYITEERADKVHVMELESSVQCMEQWNPSGGSSMWLGMVSGCLLEYSADGNYRKLIEVVMPTLSTVMIMKAHANRLFVGLLDGTLAIYIRPPGSTNLDHLSSIAVGNGPLVHLSPEGGKLWCCSGNCVVTIDLEDLHTESSRSLLLDGEELVVSLVTRVGCGLWVTFTHECSLNLYHLESLERLQEVNLSRVIKYFVQDLDPIEGVNELCHITSLASAHSQLFVGTSNGLLLAMPLPKLPDSLPKITGPCMVCRHALSGPLTFLFAPLLRNRPPISQLTMDSREDIPPPIPERDDPDDTLIAKESDKRSDEPPSIPMSPLVYREASSSRRTSLPPLNEPDLPMSTLDKLEYPLDYPRTNFEEQTSDGGYLGEQMHSIASPIKGTFVKWGAKSSRHFPVLLACGEGYRHLGEKKAKFTPNPNSPTILCWKVCT